MRFEKFTTKLQEALAEAQSAALGRDHQYIEPQHLLLALLEDAGITGLIAKAGGNPQALKKTLTQSIEKLPKVEGTPGEVHLSRELAQLLNVADKEAQKRGDQYIASELFVLAAAKLVGVPKAALEKAIEEVRGGESVTGQADEGQRQALAKYTLDLT
jgi:ATP-dependent Clp protease ATP-binding subunit ClpB